MSESLTLKQVARMFRSPTGKRLSINAVRRWTWQGVAGVKLPASGGVVTRAALRHWRKRVGR